MLNVSTMQRMESFDCPNCRARGRKIGTSKLEPVYECPWCGLCFLDAAVRQRAALDNSWYEEFATAPDSWIGHFQRQMGDAYSRQLDTIAAYTKGRRLLDVGCGVGIFLSIAAARGWQCAGVEESPHAIDFVRNRLGIECRNTLSEFADNDADAMRLSHVLEHIPEPRDALSAMARVLKPDGVLAVIVPNREPLVARAVNAVRRLRNPAPRLAGAIYPDMHVLGFSPRSLRNLLSTVGFERIEIFTVSMGSRSYFPMFYDGLLDCKRLSDIPLRQLVRYWLPMFADNAGNAFGLGEWIVAYSRKPINFRLAESPNS